MISATPNLILHNGRISTLDRAIPSAAAVAIRDGRFLAVGEENSEVSRIRGIELMHSEFEHAAEAGHAGG
jgi:predicted amidohydrolase YtcJ